MVGTGRGRLTNLKLSISFAFFFVTLIRLQLEAEAEDQSRDQDQGEREHVSGIPGDLITQAEIKKKMAPLGQQRVRNVPVCVFNPHCVAASFMNSLLLVVYLNLRAMNKRGSRWGNVGSRMSRDCGSWKGPWVHREALSLVVWLAGPIQTSWSPESTGFSNGLVARLACVRCLNTQVASPVLQYVSQKPKKLPSCFPFVY